ncbi:alanine racemase [Altererythrobacter sp.]|uniref:alanine racemase n=1 Tax=Altererythrobacter sp. TaxID=1872480 RepID=UPI003D0144B1
MTADPPPPALRLRLDKDALASNWRALDAMSGAAQAGAAVKADCYGLGVEACVPVLRDAGAEQFFVAHWSEVAAVMRHVAPDQISVLHGPLKAEDAAYARATGVVPVINSLQQAKLWLESGGGPCHLMVDTGINRLGISVSECGDPLAGQLEVDILMSHLACADEDVPMNAQQLARFHEVTPQIPHKKLSMANSAGIGLGTDYAFDLTRPGLSLYGGIARPELDGTIRQVAHPEAAILQIRDLQPGDSVGYNATFTAERRVRAGVVSLGYADGFLRCWNGGALVHAGQQLPLLGKVSMDMIVVDLTESPELSEGDWLTVPYWLPDAARQTSLSQYELLTVLGTRLKQG